jgi:hypothetical protein
MGSHKELSKTEQQAVHIPTIATHLMPCTSHTTRGIYIAYNRNSPLLDYSILLHKPVQELISLLFLLHR